METIKHRDGWAARVRDIPCSQQLVCMCVCCCVCVCVCVDVCVSVCATFGMKKEKGKETPANRIAAPGAEIYEAGGSSSSWHVLCAAVIVCVAAGSSHCNGKNTVMTWRRDLMPIL